MLPAHRLRANPQHEQSSTHHEVDHVNSEALVVKVLRIATECHCGKPAQVAVLRSFDRTSRRLAREARRALAAAQGVTTHDEPVPLVVEHRPLGHVCCYIDAAPPSSEARRLAALTSTPLVRLGNPAGTPTTERTAAIRLSHAHDRRFPSTAGLVVDVAFHDLTVRPNQPEHGSLALRIGDQPWRDLAPGTSVPVRVLPDAALVEATTPDGGQHRWLTNRLTIRRVEGLHPIYRDDLCVSDLDDAIEMTHEPEGLVEHFMSFTTA